MVMEWNSCRIKGRNAGIFVCVHPLCFACMDTLPHLPALSPEGTLPPECAEARESTKKTKKNNLQFQKPALTATSSSAFHLEGGPTHCGAVYGCGSAGLIQQFGKKSIVQNKVSWDLFIFSPHEDAFILFLVFFFNRCAEGFQFSDDLNPKTRKNLIDYWNCDMNRPYKMPRVVGGRRAQKEEVFSIIHLLQSFVLCCGKQLWQQPVLIPPNIMYRAVSFTVIPKCESCNWL